MGFSYFSDKNEATAVTSFVLILPKNGTDLRLKLSNVALLIHPTL